MCNHRGLPQSALWLTGRARTTHTRASATAIGSVRFVSYDKIMMTKAVQNMQFVTEDVLSAVSHRRRIAAWVS